MGELLTLRANCSLLALKPALSSPYLPVDAVVGHNDSPTHPTHLIALNLKGQIEMIEFPGGDVAHAKVYVVARLSGPQSDLVPVTLRLVQNRQTHLPDMVVSFGGEQVVLYNLQGAFHSQ